MSKKGMKFEIASCKEAACLWEDIVILENRQSDIEALHGVKNKISALKKGQPIKVHQKDAFWAMFYSNDCQGTTNRGLNSGDLIGLVADAYNENMEDRLAI